MTWCFKHSCVVCLSPSSVFGHLCDQGAFQSSLPRCLVIREHFRLSHAPPVFIKASEYLTCFVCSSSSCAFTCLGTRGMFQAFTKAFKHSCLCVSLPLGYSLVVLSCCVTTVGALVWCLESCRGLRSNKKGSLSSASNQLPLPAF